MSQHLEFVVPARKEEANVARLCRRFGISRKTGYKWLRRFEASREEGLLDQSCRPRHSLAQIARAVEEAILQVRTERFHRTLKAEIITNGVSRDLPEGQVYFDRWHHVYNLQRPHEALHLAVPGSRYHENPRDFPEALPPIEYGLDDIVRKV